MQRPSTSKTSGGTLTAVVRSAIESAIIAVRTIGARVHPQPVIVLGNQKSGTTAIAALLAEMTGLSAALDLRKEMKHPVIDRIKSGSLPMEAFVKINKLDFSRELIKEPSLSPFYHELAACLPSARFIMVIRDPRDNLRSILNRFRIPGNRAQLTNDECCKMSRAWELIFDGRWLGLDGKNYIEMLAQRWNYIAELYLNNPAAMLLSRYEDFLTDKVGEIARLADALNLEQKHDIADKVDIQFQPAGDRSVKWIDFFGDTNLARIESICAEGMESLHYKRTT